MKKIIAAVLILLPITAHAFVAKAVICASKGSVAVKFPTANSIFIQQGTLINNVTNMYAADGNYVTQNDVGTGGGDSIAGAVKYTGFGFSIPAGATIKGVRAELNKYSTYSTAQDLYIQLVKAGATAGDNKATLDYWPQTPTIFYYGTPTDMWGTTLTPADVNAANFGIQVGWIFSNTGNNEVVNADYVTLTFYYTVS